MTCPNPSKILDIASHTEAMEWLTPEETFLVQKMGIQQIYTQLEERGQDRPSPCVSTLGKNQNPESGP